MSSPGNGRQTVSQELQQGLLCPLLPTHGGRLTLSHLLFLPGETHRIQLLPTVLGKLQCVLHGPEEGPPGGSIPEAAYPSLQKWLPCPLWTSLGLPPLQESPTPTPSSSQNWKFHQENEKKGQGACAFQALATGSHLFLGSGVKSLS